MVDCSDIVDYKRDFQGSHQYYRRSPVTPSVARGLQANRKGPSLRSG